MGQKLGRNDPCWCGSGKKLKKCHGRADVKEPRATMTVTPVREPVPITTHKVFDGEKWVERPGRLAAIVGIQPVGTTDHELTELRGSWGRHLEENGISGLAQSLNDVEHKLRGVRYHRDKFSRVEQVGIDRFRSRHVPPTGVAFEERSPDLLFEVEGFLYQVKSTLDMLARLLAASGLRSMGHSFGDHGDHLLKQLGSVPQSCSAEAVELETLIQSAQPTWIDQTVLFRDEVAHKGMLDEFRCFVQEPLVRAGEASVHFPVMPGGERAVDYIRRIEGELRSFVDAVVKVSIRIAAKLRDDGQSSRTAG